MKIKWLGHSCFLLTSEKGTRIVTDPYDETVGYKVERIEADIVTTSHDHYDHNYIDMIKSDAKHVQGSGKVIIEDVEITGVQTFHDEVEGKKRGKNFVFNFRIDGINVCHLGDLGHVLTGEQLEKIGHVDVLLVPVGGVYTVDYKGAFEVVNLIKPSIVIPMHYKTPHLSFQIDGVNKFLDQIGGGERVSKQEIEINKEDIGGDRKVLVLDYC
ncbi:MAG TPA: MBL fold metallo-hydrolase [Acetivibrio sp.]|jgi:L-ascorbate metabolism protein UlaG (beta-lactamase superfamily)|nr:MBL fold metallo-hydrolase [Acetivibrio sp.]